MVLGLAVTLAVLAPIILLHTPTRAILPWILGDWFIDYSGGFVRRGLSGEIVYAAAAAFHLPALGVAKGILLLLFEIFIGLFSLALWRVGDSAFTLVVGSSPLWLLILLRTYGPRKDLLLLIAFYAAVALPTRWNRIATFLIAMFPFSLFVGEANFAWLPALIGIGYLRGNGRKFLLSVALSSIAIFSVCLFWRGTTTMSHAICASALHHGLPKEICSGAIGAIGENAPKFTDGIKWVPWGGSLLLQLLLYDIPFLIWLFLTTPKNEPSESRVIAMALIACFLLSVPLFAVTVDWGRWIMLLFLSAVGFSAFVRIHGGAGVVASPQKTTALLLGALLLGNFLINPDNAHGSFFGYDGSIASMAISALPSRSEGM